MKTLKKISGITLIASPFVAIYVITALKHGWLDALKPFAITGVIAAVIGMGVALTSD